MVVGVSRQYIVSFVCTMSPLPPCVLASSFTSSRYCAPPPSINSLCKLDCFTKLSYVVASESNAFNLIIAIFKQRSFAAAAAAAVVQGCCCHRCIISSELSTSMRSRRNLLIECLFSFVFSLLCRWPFSPAVRRDRDVFVVSHRNMIQKGMVVCCQRQDLAEKTGAVETNSKVLTSGETLHRKISRR